MCVIEKAQQRAAEYTAQCIAAARTPAPAGPSAEVCRQCGDEIPEGRRVACKSASEPPQRSKR